MTNTRFAAILGTSLLALAACTPAAPATDDAASSSSVDAMMRLDDSSSSVDAMAKDAAGMEAVAMQDGKMMVLWEDGETSEMDADVTLENGTVVKLDGTTVAADGSASVIAEGEGMAMDGTAMDADAVLEWMVEVGADSPEDAMMEGGSSSEAL